MLAAIAALEAKFSSGGGGVPQPPSATPPIPAPPRSCPTILTALISHSPDAKRHADAVPNAEGPEPPSRLPCFVKAELEAHLEKWEANGWRRSDGEVKNVDLVREAYELKQARPGVEIRWQKGHAGTTWNEYADRLAGAFRHDGY